MNTQSTQPQPVQSIPSRGLNIPAPLAILLVLVLAAGGAWYVWDQVYSVRKPDMSLYEAPTGGGFVRGNNNAGVARQMNVAPPPANPQQAAEGLRGRLQGYSGPGNGFGVMVRPEGFDIRLPGARARFTGKTAPVKDNAEFVYTDVGYVSLADRWASNARYYAKTDQSKAAQAKVTAEQIEKLNAITFPQMVLSPDDRAKIFAAANKYAGATDKNAAEVELANAFREVATNSIGTSQQAYTDAANQVRAILTTDQINQLRPRN